MSVSSLPRKPTWVILLALGVAACGEVATAPARIAPEASEPAAAKISGRGHDAGSRVFTIWPGLAVAQKFGDHTLFIPANAVCDPRSSHYGPAHWDLPCTPSQAPIKVTATWKVAADGEPVVSFSPDLRFVPSRDRKRWVNLSLKSPRGIDPSADYAILWYDEAVGTWVDEALTDPSLRVRLQQSGNMVSRRLKHFSRYRLSYARSSYNVPSGHRGADVGGGW